MEGVHDAPISKIMWLLRFQLSLYSLLTSNTTPGIHLLTRTINYRISISG